MPADVLEQQTFDGQFVDALDFLGVEKFDRDPEDPRISKKIENFGGQDIRFDAPGVEYVLQFGLRPFFDHHTLGRRRHRKADFCVMPGVCRDDQPAADLSQKSGHPVDPARPREAGRLIETVDPHHEPDVLGVGICAPAFEPPRPALADIFSESFAGMRRY
jgi:hypothetical protein